MSELNDSSELQLYSSAVLYVISAVHCPPEYINNILDNYVQAITSSEVSPTVHAILAVDDDDAGTGMANSTQRAPYAGRILLSELAQHFGCTSTQNHGRVARVPGRRQRRSTRDGLQGALRRRALFAETVYCSVKGTLSLFVSRHCAF
jgi:hypothetical protein